MGRSLGEHGTIGHGRDLHIQSIHIPLILKLPDIVPAAVTVQESVTLRDVPATVIDLLGLPDDGLFPGQSLRRYWIEPKRQEPEDSEFELSELSHAPWMKDMPVAKGDMKSIIIGSMHYIRNGDGTEEVYDLHEDPEERNDLIRMPRGAEAAAKARNIIEKILN